MYLFLFFRNRFLNCNVFIFYYLFCFSDCCMILNMFLRWVIHGVICTSGHCAFLCASLVHVHRSHLSVVRLRALFINVSLKKGRSAVCYWEDSGFRLGSNIDMNMFLLKPWQIIQVFLLVLRQRCQTDYPDQVRLSNKTLQWQVSWKTPRTLVPRGLEFDTCAHRDSFIVVQAIGNFRRILTSWRG